MVEKGIWWLIQEAFGLVDWQVRTNESKVRSRKAVSLGSLRKCEKG
jgi:hypothetical protein